MQKRLQRLQKFHDAPTNSLFSLSRADSSGKIFADLIKNEQISDDELDVSTADGSSSSSSSRDGKRFESCNYSRTDSCSSNSSESKSNSTTTITTATNANCDDFAQNNYPSSEDMLRTIYNNVLAGTKKVDMENVKRILTLMKISAYLFKPFINNSYIMGKVKMYTKRLLFMIGLYNVLSFALRLCEK